MVGTPQQRTSLILDSGSARLYSRICRGIRNRRSSCSTPMAIFVCRKAQHGARFTLVLIRSCHGVDCLCFLLLSVRPFSYFCSREENSRLAVYVQERLAHMPPPVSFGQPPGAGPWYHDHMSMMPVSWGHAHITGAMRICSWYRHDKLMIRVL